MTILELEIDIICLLILLMLSRSLRDSSPFRLPARSLRNLIRCFLAFTVADIVSRVIPQDCITLILFLTCFKIISCTLMSLFWFMYSYNRVETNSYRVRRWFALLVIPIAAVDIIAVVDFFMGVSAKEITFNPLLWISFNAVALTYAIGTICFTLFKAFKSKNKFLRNENLFFAGTMFIPLTAMIVQAKFIDIIITPPAIALCLLVLYITALKKEITIDPLTGLNNSNKLASHLEKATQRINLNMRLFFVIVELDNMKAIQKKFGKTVSLELVQKFAKFLQNQCSAENLFLSRSSKSKFALVFEKKSFDDVELFCKTLAANESNEEIQKIIPWPVTFSIRWAEYGTPTTKTIDDTVKETYKNFYKPVTPLLQG